MRYSNRVLALALALLSTSALAQTPTINDVQLRPGSSALWGAAFNVNNNQDIAQYNTAGSTVDAFRWFQGSSVSSATQLFSMSATGHIAGAATGGRMGAGTINATGLYVNGVAVGGGGGTPGGSPGQIQYNDAGAFGGFTTSGDATIDTATGALTLGTVNANVGTFGSATACVTHTVNAKGLTTAISAATCTPAIGSVTGLGTGVGAALAVNIGSAGAPVLFNGAAGTPTSLVGTNITGTAAGLTAGTAATVAVGGITGAGAGCITWLTTPTSANLRGCLTDEVGTGAAYFVGGALGTPASGTLTNATGLPIAGLTGLGTGIDAALAVNVGSAGAPVLFNGAGGTPTSLVGTNITGTASGLTAGTFTAGSATNLTSGTLPAARTNGHMNGTTTNDNAAAGEVGEYVESVILSGSATSLVSATAKTVTSISLTAGDWDVRGVTYITGTASTNFTQYGISISGTTNTLDLAPGRINFFTISTGTVPSSSLTGNMLPPYRLSLSGTTTVFLIAQATFTVSTATAYGIISARRVR